MPCQGLEGAAHPWGGAGDSAVPLPPLPCPQLSDFEGTRTDQAIDSPLTGLGGGAGGLLPGVLQALPCPPTPGSLVQHPGGQRGLCPVLGGQSLPPISGNVSRSLRVKGLQLSHGGALAV